MALTAQRSELGLDVCVEQTVELHRCHSLLICDFTSLLVNRADENGATSGETLPKTGCGD